MFGCLGRLGCLLLLAVLAVCGWYTKPYWYPRVHAMVVATPPVTTLTWKPVSTEAAARGARAAERMAEKTGPVFADLSPAEFAAWQLEPAMKILGQSAADAEATVHGDTLLVRANVAVNELGDAKSLGPLAGMLSGRQRVLLGGRLAMTQRGVLGLHVTQMTVNDLKLPAALIARIVARISVKERMDSLPSGIVAMRVPPSVADVRIANGKIVLYKAVP